MAVLEQTRAVIWLDEVLNVIAEFGSASLGLVAWELSLPERALGPAWEEALSHGLIAADGTDSETGEKLFRIAAAVA